MKKTIGNNPLSAYLASTQVVPEKPTQSTQKVKNETPMLSNTKIVKQRVTIHISMDLIDRVKNAVYWEPGLTIADFAESALSKALDKLEKEKGATYPARREKQLRGGRPIK